jgi:hypothetical protein
MRLSKSAGTPVVMRGGPTHYLFSTSKDVQYVQVYDCIVDIFSTVVFQSPFMYITIHIYFVGNFVGKIYGPPNW